MLENFKEVAEALESSNESVLAHQQSGALNVLTAMSVIVLPLTFIASLWGMNVHVPGEQTDAGFWIVLGCMLAVLIGMIAFFKRRGWL